MRYYFHAVLGAKQISDPEGAEFSDLYAALIEAEAAACEIASEALRAGGTVSPQWRLEIADENGQVHERFSFAALFGEQEKREGRSFRSENPSASSPNRRTDRSDDKHCA